MKLAILDRDGTLNALSEGFIASPDAWTAIEGALEAVAELNRAGWHVVVATNQPGLGGGLFDVQELNAVHAKMHRALAAVGARVEAVFYCPHAAGEECQCRTPATGLLEQIAERYGVQMADVAVVGSCLEHLQAGAALGAQLYCVRTGTAALIPAQQLPAGTIVSEQLAQVAAALTSLGSAARPVAVAR
jgi:D-glycero-D-manno-heptose 1,7-bisphosphate phosphatase